ncbi:MAG: response regulator [Planctomycetota bacterium]
MPKPGRGASADKKPQVTIEPAEVLTAPILVVEDDPLAALCVSAIVQKGLGLTISWTTGSDDAIRLIRRAAAGQGGRLPRAILADIHLQEEVSEGLISWVRTSAATVTMPVLSMSADETRTTRQRSLDAGATAFLGKSKIVTDLVAWLRQNMLSDEDADEMNSSAESEFRATGTG